MASTKLQDFREQNPQYEEWSDEELADALYEKNYSDMDRAEFNASAGIEAPPPPPPEPTVWERVKDKFTSDDKVDPLTDEKPDQSVDFDLPEDDAPTRPAPVRGDPYGNFYRAKELDKKDAPVDQGPTKADMWHAGWDEYLANRNVANIFDIGEQYQGAHATARGQIPGQPESIAGGLGTTPEQYEKMARARRADAYNEEPTKYPEFKVDYDELLADSNQMREGLIEQMQVNIDEHEVRTSRAAAHPFSQSTQDMMAESSMFGVSQEDLDEYDLAGKPQAGALSKWADDPINIMLEVSIRSAPNMTDSIPLALLGSAAGPWGFAAGMGAGSGMAEYRASFSEYMTEAGVDMEDARSIMDAIDNPELMAAAQSYSMKRSSSIAVFDAATAGLATRTIAPLAKTMLGKEMVNLGVQSIAQGAGGYFGEFTAIARTEGLDAAMDSQGELLAEVAGEFGGASLEVGFATVSGMRADVAESIAARLEAEAEEMLGRTETWKPGDDDPDGTPPPNDGALPAPETTGNDVGPVPVDPDDQQQEDADFDDELEAEADAVETIIRHADENWTVKVNNTFPDGQQDVTVTDRFGNTTDLTLKPGESFQQAVEIAETHRLPEDATGTPMDRAERDEAERKFEDAEVEGDVIEADAIGKFHEIQDMIDELRADEDFELNNLQEDVDAHLANQEELREAIEAEGVNFDTLGKGGDEAQQIEADAEDARTIEGETAELDQFGIEVGKDPDGEPAHPVTEYFTKAEIADPRQTLTTLNQEINRLEAELAEAQQEGDENSADVLIDDIKVHGWFRNHFYDSMNLEDQVGLPVGEFPNNVTDIDTARPAVPTDLENAAVIADGLVNMLDLVDTLFSQGNMAEGIIGQEGIQKIIDNLKEGMSELDPNIDDVDTTESAARVTAAIEAAEKRLGRSGPAEVAPLGRGTGLVVTDLKQEMTKEDAAAILTGLKVVKDDGTEGVFGTVNGPVIDWPGRNPYDNFARPSKKWRLAAGQEELLAQRLENWRTEQNVPAPVEPIPPSTAAPQVIDPRLRRQSFRDRLQQMSDELVHGGGSMSTLIRDEAYEGERADTGQATGDVTNRLPSENPEWFQDMAADPELKFKVREVGPAVNNAITGKRKLGVRQAKVIQHMLNLISDERDQEVDYAKTMLQEARERRQDARADAGLPFDPNEDQGGELLLEDEYSADMTADARIMYELVAQAKELGVTEDVLESLAIKHTENQPFMDAVQEQIDEQRNFHRLKAEQKELGEQQDTDATPDAEPAKPVKRKKLTAIQQDAYERTVALKSIFTAEEFLAMSTIPSGKPGTSNAPGDMSAGPGQSRMTVNTLTGLVNKGYVAELDPDRGLFEGRFVALDEKGEPVDPNIQTMPGVKEDDTEYQLAVPWTMNARGDGDLYIQRVGPNAGTPHRTRQGPSDIAISFDQAQLLPDFMFYLLQFLQKDIASRARGTAQQAIRQSDINEVLVEHFIRQAQENRAILDYIQGPVRPGQENAPRLNEAKDDAVDALDNLRATPSAAGREYARQLAENLRTDLVGKTMETVEDLAVLAQLYRDPRMETLRVFFTDDAGVVIAQVGLTTRMPAGAPTFIGPSTRSHSKVLADKAKKLGATGFFMQHNHPSGQSRPSNADVKVTMEAKRDMPGLAFRGHVVIDHNNWSSIKGLQSEINPDARKGALITPTEQDLGAVDLAPTGGAAGYKILSPSDAVALASTQEISTTDIVLVHVNHQHVVLNVSTLPGSVVADNAGNAAKLRRAVQRHALREKGTSRIVAIGRDKSLLKKLDGLVLDAVFVDNDGNATSMVNMKGSDRVTPGGDFFPFNRPPRVAPDTSEAFDYLRPFAQQEKRTGMNLSFGSARIVPSTLREDFSAMLPAKKLQIKTPDRTIEVWQNPTDQQFRQFRQGIRMELKELGYSTTEDPITRTTWDENGNRFVWESGKAVHIVMEEDLARLLGVDPATLSQHNEGEQSGGDLFGQDVTNQQAIADEIKRRDAVRNQGQESIETGDPGDLFSDARQQVDIDDLIARDTENGVEDRRGRYKGDDDDATRAQRLRSMPMDELTAAVFTDELTGAGNLKAYNEEAKMLPVQAIVDADSLKWVNDNLGYDAGDAMLVAIVNALNQADVEVYRVGGDEFIVAGWNEIEVRAALTLAEGILANQAVESYAGRSEGIGITWGIGRNKPSADVIMKGKKKHKESVGTRAKTGDKPPGATLSVVGPKPLDMAPGSNYVGMIGKHGPLPIDPNNNLVLGNGRVVRIPKKPVRREHILAVMRKYFGNRIYEGRVKGKLRLGFYRPGHGEVRLRDHNDIEVAAHEIAHFLDDRYVWIKPLYEAYRAEMLSVSYDDSLIFEGFAEFMRLYFTQESAAMARAPGFYDAWRDALLKDKKLMAMVEDLQELMHAWTMQGARARGASKQGSAEAPFWEKVHRRFPVPFWQGFLDGIRSIKKIEIDLGAVGPEELVAYEKARIALGGGAGLIDAAFRFGTPGWREDGQGIEFTGESLSAIFGKYWGDHDVGMYFLARRSQELATQGRENLMRPDEISAWIALEEEIPGLRDMHDRYQAFNSRILDFAEGAGILNAQTRAKMEEMNKNYVPMFRVVESRINGRSASSGGNPFKRLKGGTQNVEVVWDNIIEGVAIIINASLINDAKRSILRKLGGNATPNQQAGLYAAPIAKDTAVRTISGEQVLKASVEAMGWTMAEYRMAKEMPADDAEAAMVMVIESMEDGLPDFLSLFEFNQDPKGDVDYYMDNGKKYFMEIMDPALMDSLMFMGPKGTNLILQVLGGFSAVLRRGVVAWPTFQTKNFVRDSLNAWLLSKYIKIPAVRAAALVLRKMSNDPAFQEMIVNGGGFANRSQGFEVARHLITNPTEMLTRYDRFMGRFENANRLAEYKINRAKGKGPRHSAILSREVSTDFAMRGSNALARILALSVPFLNAHLQGLYRAKRQGDYRAMAISFAMRGAAMMVATLALYGLNKDDDRYEEMPEDIKDLYWVIFTGNGEDDYFLIPKPFESGMLFATIPERMMEYTEEEDGEEFADAMLWIALQTFSLDMTPQAFQPMIDLARNKTFTGAPIVPFYLDNVEPSEQFTWYTSETVIAAAQAMGISPIKLQYLIEGYFSRAGTYALAASDAMIRAATQEYMSEDETIAFPDRGETWRENILVKGLVDWSVNEGPPRRTKYVTDLYDMVREAEKVANTMALMQKRHSENAEEYISNPENQFYQMLVRSTGAPGQAGPPLAETRKGMNEVRQAMDAIRMDKVMTSDEKRIQLWNLTRQRNELARTVMEEIKRAQDMMQSMDTEPSAAVNQVGTAVDLAQGKFPDTFTGQLPPDQPGAQ